VVFPDWHENIGTEIFGLESENGCFRLLVRQVFKVFPLFNFLFSRSGVVAVLTRTDNNRLAVVIALLILFLFGGRQLVLQGVEVVVHL